MHARDISRKLKENGAKNGFARARSRRVLPYSANWLTRARLSLRATRLLVFTITPLAFTFRFKAVLFSNLKSAYTTLYGATRNEVKFEVV